MSPTQRTAALVGVLAVAGLALDLPVVLVGLAALAGAVLADLLAVREAPQVGREAPRAVARGVAAGLSLRQLTALPGRVRLRQPVPPDVELEPSESDEELDARLVARRRGRHSLARAVARRVGPLGLVRRDFLLLEDQELIVYPDLPAANRIVDSVRRGRFREQGVRLRGQLGLGTDFESIRDYQPDDDIRQVNWPATVRLGRPMSNQFRIEQDRDVVCVLDSGRLMGAPLAGGTRLDVAVDAVTAVAAVADAVGDRCGLVAFDADIRRHVRPTRRAARDVVAAVFDLEPTRVQSDYARALQQISGAKRAFVLVLTDLLEPTAAQPLVDAIPIVAHRHHVVVASPTDPDLHALVEREPRTRLDVHRAVAAAEMLDSRERATAAFRQARAVVVEAAPAALGAACVRAYLRAKARARL
jgi:uncharacterized protein (DUF58 family)